MKLLHLIVSNTFLKIKIINLEKTEIEACFEYQKTKKEKARISLRSRKIPLTREFAFFQNDIIRFVSVNSNKGVLNVYILINSKKVKSKKGENNYLKIPFEEVGTDGPKQYSSIVVNDIKIDFSINLVPKILNYERRRSSEQINIDKLEEENEKEARRKKKTKSFRIKNKFDIFQKALNILKIDPEGEEVKKKKGHHFFSKGVDEGHVDVKRDDNFMSQRHPTLSKTITMGRRKHTKENQETEENEENEKNEESGRKRLRGMTSMGNNNKKRLTLEEIITPDKQRRVKTKIEEIFLDPKNFGEYLNEMSLKGKGAPIRETFCEGFFIASFPQQNGQVVEKSQTFPASCGHKTCSSLPSMKPEIILRYPLEDTKNLEMNNLAATICFPTGIKVCYSEEEPQMIKDYVTPITNQKGERYYMMTYHFYLKMANDLYSKTYEMHPLKHHLMKFGDNYLDLNDEQMKDIQKELEAKLEEAQELGFRDYVYIPFCICLISKYPYVLPMKKCLQTIYTLLTTNNGIFKEKCKLTSLIMHLINSVPIPDIHNCVQFYIPYFCTGIEIKCPKFNDLKIMNTKLSDLVSLFSIDYIVTIFRLLLFEKKILFIDDDYTRLCNVSDNFISLLYPFQWMHTYIPIMSDQMLKYLETFLPFLNGINSSLMPLVKELFETGEMEENDEMFLINITENKFRLGSTLIGKNVKKYKYVEENVPALPVALEKDLRNKLKKIKDDVDSYKKKFPDDTDLSEYDFKIRNTFIEMFVQMFHDVEKYMCYLDEDVVFNKNLFMETIPKEDKKFYDEFIDTQLFQLFSQNIVKDELRYFKSKCKEFNNDNKFSDENNLDTQKILVKKIYIIMPDYLNIKDKDLDKIEDTINDKFVLKEETDVEGLLISNKRITEYMQKINNNNYNNNNFNIYLIPESEQKISLLSDILTKKDTVTTTSPPTSSETSKIVINQLVKYIRTKTNKNELSDKEKDAMREKIKDFTIKIFKSEEIEDAGKLKKELQNDLNTNFGREFFVNLLSKNTVNIILLQSKSFSLLGTLIYNTLLYMLQVEENNKIMGEIVILLKSTRYFAKEVKETVGIILTEEKKSTIRIWDFYKAKFEGYPKVSQPNFWNKWYEIDLKTEKHPEDDEVKKKIILKLSDLMIELELNKSFIKNTMEGLVNKVFGKEDEKGQKILKEIIQKIINAKYINKVVHV